MLAPVLEWRVDRYPEYKGSVVEHIVAVDHGLKPRKAANESLCGRMKCQNAPRTTSQGWFVLPHSWRDTGYTVNRCVDCEALAAVDPVNRGLIA